VATGVEKDLRVAFLVADDDDAVLADVSLEEVAWRMGHESCQKSGDFFQTYIGEDRVIVVRDKEATRRSFSTLSPPRQRRLPGGGRARDKLHVHLPRLDLRPQGKLVGVPGFKDYYHEDLKPRGVGIVSAAQVDTFKGFIFATLDAEAPALYDYLGMSAA